MLNWKYIIEVKERHISSVAGILESERIAMCQRWKAALKSQEGFFFSFKSGFLCVPKAPASFFHLGFFFPFGTFRIDFATILVFLMLGIVVDFDLNPPFLVSNM